MLWSEAIFWDINMQSEMQEKAIVKRVNWLLAQRCLLKECLNPFSLRHFRHLIPLVYINILQRLPITTRTDLDGGKNPRDRLRLVTR